ncbi:hypothetical protein SAMD00019534_084460 [Acytostelium subglobosum LB1]|uniref:hypothetical protein n=1 Tax=Acytostelium subglobosum LB1 TaxID=1410327 RepID=UPI000644AB63|nr:hypothetical protein SAMD00019534_084460 [Acytostelium subglobosum LB1]GAM25271.1 hypothetical protein SAMD00019534_084460 [Acytostelium subglobosum LB1]|eukprot:XP_012751791.1 hypothetical protein SAMD00019534_084460 [Acytostelium subglobosum LB1]
MTLVRHYATHKSTRSQRREERQIFDDQPSYGPHHIVVFFVTLTTLIGMLLYVFRDMIFEQRLYTRTIDELHLDPMIVAAFGNDFKSMTFHRDRAEEIALNKGKRMDDPKDYKINFAIIGENGKGMVRVRVKRLSTFKFEYVHIRVRFNNKTIYVVDAERRPPKKKTLLAKILGIFN